MNDLQIAIVTVLGAGLTIFAAWFMVARRDAGQSRAKLIGIELELPTPGLVVLIAGCGLLILPALVPHRPGGSSLLAGSGGGRTTALGGSAPVLEPTRGRTRGFEATLPKV